MAIETKSIKDFGSLNGTIEFLENLSHNGYIFRGHSSSKFLLVPSLQRYIEKRPITFFKKTHDGSLNEITSIILEKFKRGLSELGLHFDGSSNLEWLEYARHSGVPTPVLDFSYSPYIALFFAFDGIYAEYKNEDELVTNCENHENCDCSVVYAINLIELANIWSNFNSIPKDTELSKHFKNDFLDQPNNLSFQEFGFKFIPSPSKYNIRMHRQQGCLLYDTIPYKPLCKSLDFMLEQHHEKYEKYPAAHKIHIPKIFLTDIFKKLNLMGITARSLYLTEDAVAMDIKNSFNYEI